MINYSCPFWTDSTRKHSCFQISQNDSSSSSQENSCSAGISLPPDYVPSPRHLPPGTILHNRYQLGCVLGEGGNGIIYIGYDPVLEIKVAVKEFFPVEFCTRSTTHSKALNVLSGISAINFTRGMSRYLTEARILAKMDKERVIVNVRDYFEENGTAYIVMEYLQGITFSELVRDKGGRIEQEDLFRTVEPLFGALCSLHKCGLIHRDVCPDNLMLENMNFGEKCGSDASPSKNPASSGPPPGFHGVQSDQNNEPDQLFRIRLLDLGSARSPDSLKNTLTLMLRHGFAPIEQYQQGGGQGPWTDVYGLCATLYYCLTGIVPPVATNRIIEDMLIPPSKMGISIPPEREKALLKGLKVLPHRRYRTVKDLWRAFYRT